MTRGSRTRRERGAAISACLEPFASVDGRGAGDNFRDPRELHGLHGARVSRASAAGRAGGAGANQNTDSVTLGRRVQQAVIGARDIHELVLPQSSAGLEGVGEPYLFESHFIGS